MAMPALAPGESDVSELIVASTYLRVNIVSVIRVIWPVSVLAGMIAVRAGE